MSKNKKIKVLVVPSDRTGVSYFRSTKPHLHLEKLYPEEFHVDIDYEPRLNDDEWLKQYDIIHYHRTLGDYAQMEALVNKLKVLGIISIMDLDDYWNPGIHHPAYYTIKKNELNKKIVNNLKVAENVTTTTPIFAKYIKKLNRNVSVFENAIDPNEAQFKILPTKSDRIRIGWLGGSAHIKDLEILKGVASKLKSDGLLDKIQFVICGFDLRGKMTNYGPNGEVTTRDILPKESVWYEYEKIFTKDYTTISPAYKEHLLKFVEGEFEGVENEPYRRVWTKDINSYASNYNLFDISLAPLEENIFNEVKCIIGDSLVSTTDGFKEISDIVESKLKLKTELGGIKNKVINYFKYPNRETIRIKTKNGFTIEGTPHHKIYINGEWVQLDELNIDDTIELTKPTFLQNKYQEITYPMLLTKNNENKIEESCDTMLPRIIINENWGRLLGYLLGDGHIGGKSNISISYDKRHTDVIDDGIRLFKSIGLNPKLYEKTIDKRCNKKLSKEGFGVDIKLTSKTFVSIARKYNLIGKNGKIYRVPKIILQSPKSVIREFLKGLFEADGTVGKHSSVSLTSKDLKLIEQVQILLLGFGIEGRIGKTFNKHYNRHYYNISLKRVGSDIFKEEIGFVSKHKKELLNEFVNGKRSNNQHNPSLKDSIVEITRNINDVYDIEIDDVHSYNANGIKNHNSQLKVIESGFFKKPIIAQNYGAYTIDLENAYQKGGTIDDTKNGFLVDTHRNHKSWYQYIKKLVQNPELIEKIGNNLHETVSERYSLDIITKKRKDYYINLVSDKK